VLFTLFGVNPRKFKLTFVDVPSLLLNNMIVHTKLAPAIEDKYFAAIKFVINYNRLSTPTFGNVAALGTDWLFIHF
jgi:hypothetical protein